MTDRNGTRSNAGDAAPSSGRPALRRGAVVKAGGLVAIGSLGIQLSSAASAGMFDALGTPAVSSMRLVIAAVILCLVFRPRLTGRNRRAWTGIVIYGVAMAAMNISLYAAVDRLPLGVAVTLEFLGPCGVALLGSRHIKEGLCALLALAGVILIAGPSGYFDLVGYLFGLGAAFFFALYTLFAERVGKDGDGLSGLTLSVVVAALVALPFGVPVVHEVTAPQLGMLAVSAVLGVVVAYAVDMLAARVSNARVVGTLFSIDPVMGSIVGAVVLGQHISALGWLGILTVAIAGALLVWTGGPSAEQAAAEQSAAERAATELPAI